MITDTLIVVGLATISLGTIQQKGGVQEQHFLLTNPGSEMVTLGRGYTSCSCTTVNFQEYATVAPGDTINVTMRFDPQGKIGEFKETAIVVYGNNKYVQLTLTGESLTNEEMLMRLFPIRVSDNLRLDTDHFDFGEMRAGETKEREVVVLHKDENNRKERIPIVFTPNQKVQKGLQHITLPIKTYEKGREVIINVTLDVYLDN